MGHLEQLLLIPIFYNLGVYLNDFLWRVCVYDTPSLWYLIYHNH